MDHDGTRLRVVVGPGWPDKLTLYLNGECVATGPGSPDLTTDALDFFNDPPAAVEGVRLDDRALAPGGPAP